MSAPIEVVVKRYRCPHCNRSRSTKRATLAHMGRCWLNPDNRTCKTCANFELNYNSPCDVRAGCTCQDSEPYCEAGVELPEGKDFPVTNCDRWKDAER